LAASRSTRSLLSSRGKLGNNYGYSGEASWDTQSENDRHLWDAPNWLARPGDDFYRYHSKVYHSSEMLNLTHSMDYATAWWILPKWHEGVLFAKGDTEPDLQVSISRDPEGEEQLSDSEQEPYGMKTESRWTERSVDQLLKAAKR
jgi:hypothetical protein